MAGLLIRFIAVSDTFQYSFKLDLTIYLGNNNVVERIPGTDHVTFCNFLSVFYIQNRTVRNVHRVK